MAQKVPNTTNKANIAILCSQCVCGDELTHAVLPSSAQ